jgi:hypothetical protein
MARAEGLSGEERADLLMGVADLRWAQARVADGLDDEAGTAGALAQTYDTLKEAAGTTSDPRVRSEIEAKQHEVVGMTRQPLVFDWVEDHENAEVAATLLQARQEYPSLTGFENTVAAYERLPPDHPYSEEVYSAADSQLKERSPRDGVERHDLAVDRARLILSKGQVVLTEATLTEGTLAKGEAKARTLGGGAAWLQATQAIKAFKEAGQDAWELQARWLMVDSLKAWSDYEAELAGQTNDNKERDRRTNTAEARRRDADRHADAAYQLDSVVHGEAG